MEKSFLKTQDVLDKFNQSLGVKAVVLAKDDEAALGQKGGLHDLIQAAADDVARIQNKMQKLLDTRKGM